MSRWSVHKMLNRNPFERKSTVEIRLKLYYCKIQFNQLFWSYVKLLIAKLDYKIIG